MNHEGEMMVNCEMVLIAAEVKIFFLGGVGFIRGHSPT